MTIDAPPQRAFPARAPPDSADQLASERRRLRREDQYGAPERGQSSDEVGSWGYHRQPGSWAGKAVTEVLCPQQLPKPVPSHSRSAPGSGAMSGLGDAPFPVTLLNTMWLASALGSMPSAAHWAGLRWKALHKLATMTPNELLPCTWLWS